MNNFLTSWTEYILSRTDLIGSAIIEHLIYTITVVVSATIFSITIGILSKNNEFLKELSLSIASVFLTLPSLALFTIFIPLVGLGFTPSFIALFMYAILPILRNTITGLQSVDSSIVESAKGMGMDSSQQLRYIQLPIAWPVILAGIRVSTLLTVSVAAIATLVAGGGLGDFIKSGLARIPLPNSFEAIWTGVVFCVILAFLVDLVLSFINKYTVSGGLK